MKKPLLSLVALAASSMLLVAQPIITNQPASQAVWAGANVRISVGVSNAGSFTYQWQFNSTNMPTGIITTVAGGAINDGGLATNAYLQTPFGITADAGGTLFIVE